MENNDTLFSEIKPEETEAGLMQCFLTQLIDIGIEMLVLFLAYRFMPAGILQTIANRGSYLIFFMIIMIFF